MPFPVIMNKKKQYFLFFLVSLPYYTLENLHFQKKIKHFLIHYPCSPYCNFKLPYKLESSHSKVLPLVGWRAVRAILLNVHTKEAQVNAIDLFKGKEGFGSIWKGFCHLSTIYKSIQFTVEGKKYISFRLESSIVTMCEQLWTHREERGKLLDTLLSCLVWLPQFCQKHELLEQWPLLTQGDFVASETHSHDSPEMSQAW